MTLLEGISLTNRKLISTNFYTLTFEEHINSSQIISKIDGKRVDSRNDFLFDYFVHE